MGIFKNLFPANIKNQTSPTYNRRFMRAISSVVNLPQSVDKAQLIEDGYQKNATVFSIVNYLNNSAASIPIKVYKVNDSSALKDYKALLAGSDATSLRSSVTKDRALTAQPSHDLQKLLDRPHPDMGYFQWMQEVYGFLQLTGDSFIWGISPKNGVNAGKPKELYPLPSQYMEIVLQDSVMKPIKGYHFNAFADAEIIPFKDVGHVKTFNPDWNVDGSHLYGQSPLTASFRNLAINNDSIDTGSNFLKNQGARGILSSDDMGMLDEAQAKTLQNRYKEKYGGSDQAGQIMITNHAFKWINMGLPASDVALMEQYNMSKEDIAAAYNFPYLLLGNTSEFNNANYREAKKQMYLQKVIPDLCLIRDELNRWLTPAYGDNLYIDFDYSVIPELQEDLERVTKQLNVSWWLTPNEKRRMQSFEELKEDGMDSIFIPANLINLPMDGEVGANEGGNPIQRLQEEYDKIYIKD